MGTADDRNGPPAPRPGARRSGPAGSSGAPRAAPQREVSLPASEPAAVAARDAAPWPPARRRRARDFDAKREAVIRTAAQLFQARGYDNTSLNEIAAALNVTKPTLYYYVESKAEILNECRLRTWEKIHAAMEAAANSGSTGRQKLEAFMASYAEAISTDYGKCLVMTIRGAGDVSDEMRGFRDELRRATHDLQAILREGMADGSIAAVDPKLASFAIYGALNWIAYWFDPDGPESAEDIGGAFVRYIVDGLAPRGPGRA